MLPRVQSLVVAVTPNALHRIASHRFGSLELVLERVFRGIRRGFVMLQKHRFTLTSCAGACIAERYEAYGSEVTIVPYQLDCAFIQTVQLL